jgi:hypothetical protein
MVALLPIALGLAPALAVPGSTPASTTPAAAARAADSSAASLTDFENPARGDASFPQLVEDGRGGAYMTWFERTEVGHRLQIARATEQGFGVAKTVHEGADFWKNWADFPGAGVFPDGAILVHWLSRSGGSTYDYDIKARISKDGGETWGTPFLINTDGGPGEHGFVSYARTLNGLMVAWLDGREMKPESHEGSHGEGAMTLRAAEFGSDGNRVNEARLDDRVCECCQTSAAATSRGPLVAFRDRSQQETRDISLVRATGPATSPDDLSRDGWTINACPVNGPALAARGDAVAAVWFTQGGGARVRAAASIDAGETFSPPVDLDGAAALGRVDVSILRTGAAVATWMRRAEGGKARIVARVFPSLGSLGAPSAAKEFEVGLTASARASGFPRMESLGDAVLIAWTEPGREPQAASTIRTKILRPR